jgi:hypothetical protein
MMRMMQDDGAMIQNEKWERMGGSNQKLNIQYPILGTVYRMEKTNNQKQKFQTDYDMTLFESLVHRIK